VASYLKQKNTLPAKTKSVFSNLKTYTYLFPIIRFHNHFKSTVSLNKETKSLPNKITVPTNTKKKTLFTELIRSVAFKMEIPEIYLEKDYWITKSLSLERLFSL
jgi:hypothetical protein